ncbi:hypothetical protein [Edaphobacter bradus]|uniref:hypothetical protein n=1 Tax=Edaphobacter bradus TaxID=2259016 RepID=UPI0021DFB1B6|nr:hypothetical protein [Edaphobacter bradus]
MKTGIAILTAMMSMSAASYGQATPTAVASGGSALSPSQGASVTDGAVHYSLSASEIIQHGLYTSSTTDYTTSFSGSAGYISSSQNRPFSLLYTGGLLVTSYSGQRIQTFQNAALTQQLVTRHWIFGVSDSVSYLPQSPTTGYSGIAGVGDLGTLVGPATGPAGGILTGYGKRLSNGLSGTIERKLGASTSVSGTGNWDILRFLDGVGLDTTSVGGTAALNRRLDARNTVSVNASYSIFTYGTYYGDVSNAYGLNGLSFQSRGINLSYQRLLTRSLSMNLSAGPQSITSSNKAVAPSRLTVSSTASLFYTRKVTSAALSFIRGANGGSGVQQGTIANVVGASLMREFGSLWQATATLGYSHSEGLIQSPTINAALGIRGTYNSVYGGVQVTRALGRHASCYASYTIENQSNSLTSAAVPNVFNGTANIIGIGITYAPRSTRLGQF